MTNTNKIAIVMAAVHEGLDKNLFFRDPTGAIASTSQGQVFVTTHYKNPNIMILNEDCEIISQMGNVTKVTGRESETVNSALRQFVSRGYECQCYDPRCRSVAHGLD